MNDEEKISTQRTSNELSNLELPHIEAKIKNDDGTFTKFLELEQLAPLQRSVSDTKDTVTLSLPCRIEILQPLVVNHTLELTLQREYIRQMAVDLGLIDS